MALGSTVRGTPNFLSSRSEGVLVINSESYVIDLALQGLHLRAHRLQLLQDRGRYFRLLARVKKLGHLALVPQEHASNSAHNRPADHHDQGNVLRIRRH